jgi:hypothetical protein
MRTMKSWPPPFNSDKAGEMTTFEKMGFLSDDIEKYIAHIREKHNHWFELSYRISRLANQLCAGMQVSKESLQQLLVSTLFSRILSHYQGVVILCERGMQFEAKVLLRSVIEILFSLVALKKDESLCLDFIKDGAFHQLRKINLYKNLPKKSKDKHKIKALDERYKEIELTINYPPAKEAGMKHTSLFLQKLIKLLPPSKLRRLLLTALKEDNRGLTTEFIAQKAGRQDYYNTIYSQLSDTVHCRSLDLERHLNLDSGGNLRGLVWGPRDDDLNLILLAASESMLRASFEVIDLFRLTGKEECGRLWEQLSQLED